MLLLLLLYINKRNYTYNQANIYIYTLLQKKTDIYLLQNFSRLLAVTANTYFTHMLRHAEISIPRLSGCLNLFGCAGGTFPVWRFGGLFRGARSPFRKQTPQCCIIPTCSMYGIFTYFCVVWGVNVGKYTMH